jgi:hypothetical protein
VMGCIGGEGSVDSAALQPDPEGPPNCESADEPKAGHVPVEASHVRFATSRDTGRPPAADAVVEEQERSD